MTSLLLYVDGAEYWYLGQQNAVTSWSLPKTLYVEDIVPVRMADTHLSSMSLRMVVMKPHFCVAAPFI